MAACFSQPLKWSAASILRHSVVAVAFVGTRLRAISLATVNMRKSIHGFPFFLYEYVAPVGGPLGRWTA